MIRSESVENPLLILLHGGPGFSEMRLFRHFNASLEKSFTVVYWDQRGTNKSFHTKIPKSSMTVERFIADLDELVELVRKRFNKDHVALYGHSWGSALGVLYAARFPQKVAAYVGAPRKSLVWFENSAHEPPFEEPSKFNAAMVDLVRTTFVGT